MLTVEEFTQLPAPSAGHRQELHHGKPVEWPPVKMGHTKTQRRLVSLLECIRTAECAVDKEFPFRPTAEHEVWIADVALYNVAAWEATADDDYFRGVPTLVAEVLSPSNTATEMLDREEICLRNGGQEFWLVDPERRSVKVIQADGHSRIYHAAEAIHSSVLSHPLAVSEIF